jgi:hypothetical protein
MFGAEASRSPAAGANAAMAGRARQDDFLARALEPAHNPPPTCNLYSVTKGQQAIRDLFAVKHDGAGQHPAALVTVKTRQQSSQA